MKPIRWKLVLFKTFDGSMVAAIVLWFIHTYGFDIERLADMTMFMLLLNSSAHFLKPASDNDGSNDKQREENTVSSDSSLVR